jgi:hypothetical protein
MVVFSLQVVSDRLKCLPCSLLSSAKNLFWQAKFGLAARRVGLDQPEACERAASRGQAAICSFVASFEQGEIGTDLFRHACLMGLEGLVSKLRDLPYRPGRSPHASRQRTGSIRRSAA